MQVTVVNEGLMAEEIGFYSYFPATAKIHSFSMNQDDQVFHGKRVSHSKAHEIVKRAAEENSNAGFYIPQFMQGKINICLRCFNMCQPISQKTFQR